MFQQYYEPPPALKGFVNNIIIDHFQSNTERFRPAFTIPPLPEHCLMFYLRDASKSTEVDEKIAENLTGAIIIGPNLSRHNIEPGKDHLMVKVGFQAGGLYRLLGIPMTKLLSTGTFQARELMGNGIDTLLEKLRETSCYIIMKSLIEQFLLRFIDKLQVSRPIDAVLPAIIRAGGLIRIEQLAADSCLSLRQFERNFQQRIGLSPKQFTRLVRFGNAWIMKQQRPNASWLNVAHASGYFDQMHMIRDFQEFAGVNPSVIEKELVNSPIKNFTRLFH